MSDHTRLPSGLSDDPEYSYRRGYHEGVIKAYWLLSERGIDVPESLVVWYEKALLKWRNTPGADPVPPLPRR